MAPINKTFTCSQMRLENSLAKAPRIVIYSVGKVGISNLLAEFLLQLALLLAIVQMDKV